MEDGERKVERRSSRRQPVPGLQVELRRVGTETPTWVCSAADISLRGMLLRLPPELGPGEYLHVGFILGDSHAFRRLGAVVLSRRPRRQSLPPRLLLGQARRPGELGALGFTAWPWKKRYELEVWLKERSALKKAPQP